LRKVKLTDWKRIGYEEAWDHQTQIQQELIAYKRGRLEDGTDVEHQFVFCEHEPVYTLGKSGSMDHLLLSEAELQEKSIHFHKINRGGDITYHGPGQVVGYPILDLDDFFTDVHKYVRFIEEAIIQTLASFGIHSDREPGYTGVWLPATNTLPRRKICAIGVHLSRWVTMHGFALNVQPDLTYFGHIIPCGINDEDKAVTSMELELGHTLDLSAVKREIAKQFKQLFGWEWSDSSDKKLIFAANDTHE
jgi:lipoyl(octanoyl) transferase